ncbi:MAG: hypothetical protein BroJett040_00610 [Oligoflexia bacterium]|nr:MAG: hypothetical protein BroJett040_00610 [Oligoflexia bacterium]
MEELKEVKGIEREKGEVENIIKITVTKEAGEMLADLVVKANEGFEGGRINRQDLASFIIGRFKEFYTDRDLMQLRNQHYDDAAMLEAMYRKMRETGEVPDFLRDALRKQFQVPDESPKKSKRSLTKESINDGLQRKEG